MERPADACPYPRPFPEDFDDCLTYQGTVFVGLDLQYRPLRPSRTCRFLTVGEIGGRPGTFYGRCALGDAAARQRWMSSVDRDRVQRLQDLRLELTAVLRPTIEELWRLKGDQLRLRRLGGDEDPAALNESLRRLAERVNEQVSAFFEARSQTLEELQLPRDSLMQVTRLALDAFVEQTTAEQSEVELPQEVLDSFPPEVLSRMRPDAQAGREGG